MNAAERIDFLIKRLEGDNASAFAEKTGIPTPTVSKIRAGKLGYKKRIDDILRAYPEINRDWLVNGVGYVGDVDVETVKQHYGEEIAKKEKTIETLLKEIALLQRVIEEKLQ